MTEEAKKYAVNIIINHIKFMNRDSEAENHVSKFIVKPMMEGIFEQFPEKTSVNFIRISLIIQLLKQDKIVSDVLKILIPLDNSNSFLRVSLCLQTMFPFYKQTQKVFNGITSTPPPEEFYDKLFEKLIIDSYSNNVKYDQLTDDDNQQIKTIAHELLLLNNDKDERHLSLYNRTQQDLLNNLRGIMGLGINSFLNLSNLTIAYNNEQFENPANRYYFCFFNDSTFKSQDGRRLCIHCKFYYCSFVNTIFEKGICVKMSQYHNSDFSDSDMTGFYNSSSSEVEMHNVNFSGTRIIRDVTNYGTECMEGKRLLKSLYSKGVVLESPHYLYPEDGGVTEEELMLDQDIFV